MGHSLVAGRLEAARQRLVGCIERSPEPGGCDGVLREALEQLEQALEELQGTGTGRADQNDAWAAMCARIEAERERYRSLFASMPTACLVTARDGTILEANRAAGILLNVDQRALIGQPLERYIAEAQRAALGETLRRIEEAPGAVGVELDLLPHGGTAIPLLASAELECRAVRDGARQTVCWMLQRGGASPASGVADALPDDAQHVHDTLQIVMENTQAQLAYLDAELRIVRVNAAFAQASGHRREDLLGRRLFDLFPSSESQAVFEHVIHTGRAVSFVARPVTDPNRPERGTVYLDWRLTPISDAQGSVYGLVLSLLDVTERERLLDMLAAERARLHTVIANAPGAIVVTDEAGRIVLANSAARDLGFVTGSSAQQPSGEGPGDELGSKQRIAAVFQAVAAGGPVCDVEVTGERADGEVRDLVVSAAPIRDGAETITGGVAVLQDITEWKRTQEALRRYAERLQILHELDEAVLTPHSVEAIAEAALHYAWQLVPCLWAAVAMFAADRDEVELLAARADRETALTTGWRGPLDWCWFTEELAAGKAHVVENLGRLPCTSTVIATLREQGVRTYVNVPLLAQGRLIGSLNLGIADPGGLLPGHVDTMQEMANSLAIAIHQAELSERVARHAQEMERRVAERTAALRASEARFRTVFEESAIGIALLDLEGRILDANPALQGILDRDLEDLVGEPLSRSIAIEAEGSDGDSYTTLLAGQCDYYRAERPCARHSGGEAWVLITLSLVRRHGGIPWFVIAMVADVTEERAMRAALAEAEKLTLTGRLVASLTHEINNPLQAVIGCLGLAQEALAQGDNPDRFLNVAREELRRTSSIVGHLRDLYRPVQPGEKKPSDANALIQEVLELSRKQVSGRGIHVVTEWGDLPPVPMIVDRMRQVVLNLVLNAVDAMPDGGRLHIATAATRRPQGVRITFRDEGVGISPDILPHIFDSFYSTKQDGLGLGLFITRGIIREHGGTITAASQPDEGTTFTIWLPLGSRASEQLECDPTT